MKTKELTFTLTEDGESKTVELLIRQPNNQVIREADQYRARIWGECIKNPDILMKTQVMKIMRERGIWDDSKEKEYNKIVDDMRETERVLRGGGKKKVKKMSEAQRTALKLRQLRQQLRELLMERASLEDSTAENIADNARFDYFVSACTFYKSGEKVYSNIEDYNSRSSDTLAFYAASALSEMMYSIDMEENLPENAFLKKHNLLEENLVTECDGKRYDAHGKEVVDTGVFSNDFAEFENDLADSKEVSAAK